MDKNPVRRIVTGHDADGKAVVLIDAPTPTSTSGAKATSRN